MVPELPLELQTMILHQLAALHWGPDSSSEILDLWYRRDDFTHTLARCREVCKIWAHICQPSLMRIVSLKSKDHLEDFASVLRSSRTLKQSVLSLRLFDTQPRNFSHLAPIYLARNLLALQTLSIHWRWYPKTESRTFPVQNSLTMHLSQLKSLTHLKLIQLRFRIFWDLRRLLVSLPQLTDLCLHDVYWPSTFADSRRSPSLLMIPRRLNQVTAYWQDPTNSHLLWLWATTVSSSTYIPYHGINTDTKMYPAFQKDDVEAISGLITILYPANSQHEKLGWCYDEYAKQWNFQYGDGVLIGIEPLQPCLWTKVLVPTDRMLARLISLDLSILISPKICWPEIEQACERLEHIQRLTFHLRYQNLDDMDQSPHKFLRLMPILETRAQHGFLTVEFRIKDYPDFR